MARLGGLDGNPDPLSLEVARELAGRRFVDRPTKSGFVHVMSEQGEPDPRLVAYAAELETAISAAERDAAIADLAEAVGESPRIEDVDWRSQLFIDATQAEERDYGQN